MEAARTIRTVQSLCHIRRVLGPTSTVVMIILSRRVAFSGGTLHVQLLSSHPLDYPDSRIALGHYGVWSVWIVF